MRSHHRTAALLNMVLSCVICSIAVNWIALPNGFVVTGITGLAMTAETFTGINYALIYYGLTLAILLFTAVTLGCPASCSCPSSTPWSCGCSTMCRWRSF